MNYYLRFQLHVVCLVLSMIPYFMVAQNGAGKYNSSYSLSSATIKNTEEMIRCYTMEMDSIRRANHPNLPSLQQEEFLFQKQINAYKNGKSGKGSTEKATLLTIPCIFHIITDGAGAENISAAQVQAQVDQLNIDFRNLAGSTHPAAADVEIEFCLAILDENDNLLAEPGINRVTAYGDGPFNTNDFENNIKPGTFWDPDQYMNVWVADLSGGLLGYAQFPSNSGLGGLNANGGAASTDGVVHLYSTIGSVANPFPGGAPYNLGRTMTHEVGHWLGLRHIWGDANCGNDFCGDTPQSQTSNFGCPNLTTCDGVQDMVENYMDYTNDACMNIFTADQKDRIRTVMLNSPRRALLPNSQKCGLPVPNIGFINVNGGSINEGENCDYVDVPVEMNITLPPTDDADVTFTLTGNNTATLGVDFDIITSPVTFPAGSSNNQSFIIRIYNDAIIETNEIIELQIVVTTNGDAIASITSGIYTLTILDANFVASNILFEDFESGGLGSFTTQGAAGSDNFQNGTTNTASSQFWIIEPTNATQFAYSNDDACDCDKSNDRLTSPVFSLAGYTANVFLEFDHAYSAYTSETAEVQINTGAGWNTISTLNNTSANNNNTLTTPWVNGNQIDLNPYLGQNNVQIRFRYDDGGQWAYGIAVDNIRIYTDNPVSSSVLAGTDTQNSCGPFTWIDGNTYTTSNNTATYTIPNGAVNGCDSTVALDLTINNSVTGTDTQVACGSYTWIDGNTYNTGNNSATFNIVGGAANGCDSLVTLDLTINNSVNGTDTQVACGSYTWIDGNTYNTSNNSATFNIVGGAATGCDSLVTLNLTINNSVSGTDTQIACGSYTWIDGNTYTTSNNSATFNILGGAANGCDSIVTLDLTINNSLSGMDTQVACESYTWIDGNTYTASNNSATFTIPNGAVNGCDSTITLDLTINNSVSGMDTQIACGSYTWIDGNTYTASNNTATFTIPNGSVNGCDSIVTLDLTISNSVSGTDSQIACGSYTWIDGNTYTASNNTATFTIPNGSVNGCDSIVTLDLTISNSVSGTDTQVACGSYTWIDGITYTASINTATFTIPNGSFNGCDSIVTLDLTINNSVSGTDTQVACDSYTWIDGNTYTASNNSATFNILNGSVNGCDSLVTLNLTINNSVSGTDTQVACGSYTWIDGNTYTASNNTATFTIPNGSVNGCDSIVTLDLTISNSVSGTDTQVACGPFTWIDGNTYTTSNNSATFNIIGGAANGCDSLVTLNLTINNSVNGTDTQVACGSYTWIDGNTYTASNNSATFTLPNGSINGCDSIVTLNLTISNSVSGTDSQIACGSYTWIDGNTYTTSNNSATFTIPNGSVNGCDSIVTLDLTINNSVSGTDTQVACGSYTWIDGNTYTASNNSATFTIPNGSINGCDSIVTLDLTISNTVTTIYSETFDQAVINGANASVLYGNGGSDFNSAYALSGTFFGWFNVQNGIGDVDIYDVGMTGINPGCTVTASAFMRMSFNAPNVTISLIDDNGVILDETNVTLTTSWQLITLNAQATTNGLNYVVHYNSTGGNGLDVIIEDFEVTQTCGITAEIASISDQCFNGNNFTFDGSASISSAPITNYTWDFGDSSPLTNGAIASHSYLNPGQYDVNLSVSDGICTDDTTISVNVIQNPIAPLVTDVVECDAYVLPLLSSGNYFTQSNGQGTILNSGSLINSSQSLFVFVESGTNPNCTDETNFTITINNSDSGIDTQAACGSFTWIDGNTYTASNNTATFTIPNGSINGCDSIVTLDLTINNIVYGTDTQTACESFTWIDGNTYTASNNSATFTLLGGAVSGCDSIVALDLTINNSVFSSDVQSACDSYTWIDGNTYTSDNNTATYVLSTISGCDSVVTLDLTINALTTLDAGLDIFICSGEEIILNASGASTYTWSNGVSNGESFTSSEGVNTYIVNAEDNNGCTATDQVIVTAWPVPTISISGEDPLCLGENSGSAEILISSGTPPFTIEWNNGDTLSSIQNLYAGIFDVLVTDANTCEASSSIVLSDPFEPCYEEPEINIYIPNSFSPDNNEHNQTWFVVAEGISFENFTLLIFNRWGTLIWESHDIRVGWDGTYKNKNVPDGTYTYKLEYQEAAGEPLKFATGHLNVLR